MVPVDEGRHCGCRLCACDEADNAQRITYWLAPDRRVVPLTVFRETKMRETAEVARAHAAQAACEASHAPAPNTTFTAARWRNCHKHAEWKTRRHRKLLGEAVEENTQYDRLYEEAELAHDLGQLVYDRRTALGLSQEPYPPSRSCDACTRP
ncbi:hypothetical protein [Streptomyces sp. NBC_01017]|uniref:hypothetical protein n=1 Tax=Streptomyces sp. NBC_01017 TaxID=2903721 RepID=UPI003870E194